MYFSGLPVYYLPPVFVWKGNYQPVRYSVHPIIKWLSKYFPIEPWIDGVKPLLIDENADKCYRIGNSIYAGTRVFEQLIRYTKERPKP